MNLKRKLSITNSRTGIQNKKDLSSKLHNFTTIVNVKHVEYSANLRLLIVQSATTALLGMIITVSYSTTV